MHGMFGNKPGKSSKPHPPGTPLEKDMVKLMQKNNLSQLSAKKGGRGFPPKGKGKGK